MAKFWFVAKLGEYEGAGNGFVPAINKYPISQVVAWSNPDKQWCIGKVGGVTNVGQLKSDPDIVLFPDSMLLDYRFDVFGAGVRNALLNQLQAKGFDISGITTNLTNRQIISYLVNQVQPGVDPHYTEVLDA